MCEVVIENFGRELVRGNDISVRDLMGESHSYTRINYLIKFDFSCDQTQLHYIITSWWLLC